MELFDTNGHLTDCALLAVQAQTLDEMNRLEAAEHLSFCDDCLLRYTALLTDDTLLTPQNPIAPPVWSRIRRKTMQVFFNKYTTVAAAASFALILWSAGVFTTLTTPRDFFPNQPKTFAQPVGAAFSLSQKSDTICRNINDALNEAVSSISRLGEKPAANARK
ncbi:MAG: hypothetical protein RR709_05970 [Ruthenibacterium sp.]